MTRTSEERARIFLSYAAPDREFVAKVAARLRAGGLEVFFDRQSELQTQSRPFDAVQEAIRNCDLFVLFLSGSFRDEGSALTDLRFAEALWADPSVKILLIAWGDFEMGKLPAYLRTLPVQSIEGDLAENAYDSISKRVSARSVPPKVEHFGPVGAPRRSRPESVATPTGRHSIFSDGAIERSLDAEILAHLADDLEELLAPETAALPAVSAEQATPLEPVADSVNGTTPSDAKRRAVCSVFCPPSPMVGDQFLVQVFAHPEGAERQAAQLAKEADTETESRGRRYLPLPIPVGTKLRVELSASNLRVENSVEDMLWTGSPESVQFVVTVPAELTAKSALIAVTFLTGLVPLGTIRFSLQIGRTGGATITRLLPRLAPGAAQRFEKIFASYAHEDQRDVLRCVQAARALGHDPFMDIVDLPAGTRWERDLHEAIDQCDLFLLFWSRHAKTSDWVMKETRRALARQAGDASSPPPIRPVVLEGPPVPSPPDDLKHLHFNDPLVLMISALDAQPGQKPPEGISGHSTTEEPR